MDKSYFELIESSRVAPATRKALLVRSEQTFHNAPLAIDPVLYPILQSALARLIPQEDRLQPIDLAGWLDLNLSCGRGNGWRYADMPADEDALPAGLRLLDGSALQTYGQSFIQLTNAQMDDLLSRVQSGEIHWPSLNAKRWFEELLTDVTELFVAHPDTLDEIGFSGIAILPKWERIGLNDEEPWEAQARE